MPILDVQDIHTYYGDAYVLQGRRVFPTLSVEDNLLVAEHSAARHGWSLARVYALFPRLLERRRQRAKTLSGGEQQMLAIGRGLDRKSVV